MIARCWLVTVLLVGAWAGRASLGAPAAVTTGEPLSRFPISVGPWIGQDSPLDPVVVKTAAVDDYLNRKYRAPSGELGFYIGYYRSQRRGEALHSPLFCLPGSGWQPIATREVPLKLGDATVGTAKELVVARGIDRLLVLYWYQTLKRVTASEYARKLYLIADAFTSRRTDVALVRVIAPIDVREEDSERRALALARPFAESVLPEVQTRLFRE
jgi:EpsI family protein